MNLKAEYKQILINNRTIISECIDIESMDNSGWRAIIVRIIIFTYLLKLIIFKHLNAITSDAMNKQKLMNLTIKYFMTMFIPNKSIILKDIDVNKK